MHDGGLIFVCQVGLSKVGDRLYTYNFALRSPDVGPSTLAPRPFLPSFEALPSWH